MVDVPLNQIKPNSCRVSTIIEFNYFDTNETPENKAWMLYAILIESWKQHLTKQKL